MTSMAGIERPFSGNVIGGYGENYRSPLITNAPPVAATVPLHSVGTTPLTTVTATVHCASLNVNINQPISKLVTCVTTTGTVTGFWYALLDAGLIVRAVSANVAATSAGYFSLSVLPASNVPYVATYSGLFYVAVGTVSSVAVQLSAQAAAPSVAAVSGPPIYCGTSATAATTAPPIVGAQLGALTGVASNQFLALAYA